MPTNASSFSFQTSELPEQLKQAFNEQMTGYWQIKLVKANSASSEKLWFLAVVQGRVIFSGTKQLSWTSFVTTLKRYILRLRDLQSEQLFQQLQRQLPSWQRPQLGKILLQMAYMKLLDHNEAIQVLRLQILSDLDTYLFDYSGEAEFIPDSELVVSAPILGFELSSLLLDAAKRWEQWRQLEKYELLQGCTLILKPEAVEGSKLTTFQKQQLQSLVGQGRTLDEISYSMSKDSLEVAKAFARLIQDGLVTVTRSGTDGANADALPEIDTRPEIFIVDDSPIVVQQFRHLVENWGYRVSYSNNALTAVQTMLESKPAVIFLDLNMPGASGFELIKQIRRQSQLSSLPLVLLTAEKSVSNKWRAQWASCKFLAKPHMQEEVSTFRTDLHTMLQEMIPIAKDTLVQTS